MIFYSTEGEQPLQHHIFFIAGYAPRGSYLIANNFMEFWETMKETRTLYVAPKGMPKAVVSVHFLAKKMAFVDSDFNESLAGWSMDEARTLTDLLNLAVKDLSPQRATNCYPYSGGKQMLLVCVKG